MHEKKPLVPEKYFGPLPGTRCEEPLAGAAAQTWAPIFSSRSMQALLPAEEKAGGAAQPQAGVRKAGLNINSCRTQRPSSPPLIPAGGGCRGRGVALAGAGPSRGWQQEGTASLGQCPLLEQARSQMPP